MNVRPDPAHAHDRETGPLSPPPSGHAPRPGIHGFTREELIAECLAMQQPAYRASQIWQWLYLHGASAWDDMKNLPLTLRKSMQTRFRVDGLTCLETLGHAQGTRKLLLELHDGERIEEVLIPAGKRPSRDSQASVTGRRTVCVSTQVGCRFHCAFCASGQAGFRRHLEPSEIVGQVVLARRAFTERPTHVVFMGIGEPLDNVDAVLKAISILNDKAGLNIAARRLTVSTCGVVPGIERLAGLGLQVELSVSLHAPDNALRSSLMPVNRRYPIEQLLQACKSYTAATKRIITFEYTLMRGLNDRPEQAEALAALLTRLPCRVNLIPLSPVAEFDVAPAEPANLDMFSSVLKNAGIHTTVRASKGSSVKAACGQLRIARSGDTRTDQQQEPGTRSSQ